MDALSCITGAKRVVIKIGSALLVEDGIVRQGWLNSVAADIAAFRAKGTQVVVVSSGSIAVGRQQLGLAGPKLRLEEKQAAAAVGQIELATAWREALAGESLKAAQVLITLGDTEENRRRYLNARDTLETLLKHGAVPVINENDTVATSEIRFGDNDRLGARVAGMLQADALFLLSDIDGLYTDNPRVNPDARHLPVVEHITAQIENMAGAPLPGYSSGGMKTKLDAAKIATAAGCAMIISNGAVSGPVQDVLNGGRHTLFTPSMSGGPKAARKHWIAGHLETRGSVSVDAGAARALGRDKSLLPSGVTAVEGEFRRGDVIAIRNADGSELARGLSAYDSEDALKIIGHRSSEFEALLGYSGRQELVHRDDLVPSGLSASVQRPDTEVA